MQKILTLIITGAILYMILQNHISSPYETDKKENKKEVNNTEKFKGNFVEKTLSNIMVNVLKTDEGRTFVENVLQPVDKPIISESGFKMNNDHYLQSIFDIKSFGSEDGEIALCGQMIDIEYKILGKGNLLLEEHRLSAYLGSKTLPPGFGAIIAGMRTGQTRHATISSKYIPETANNKVSNFKVNIKLNSINPSISLDKVKIFDDEISYKIPFTCGNNVIFDTKITDLTNAKLIYNSLDTEKINMRIGDIRYPIIFSISLHNKSPSGIRTVITRGDLLESYLGGYSTILPNTTLPKNKYYMIEFFNFEDQFSS